MTYDPTNDPRLTAYALGELPAEERDDVERLLATSPEARRFVEETRAFAASLDADLALAPTEGLTEPQRLAVRAAVGGGKAGRPRLLRAPHWPVPAGLAAAALVAVAFLGRNAVGRWWTGGENEVARLDRAPVTELRYQVELPAPPRAAQPAEVGAAIEEQDVALAPARFRESGGAGARAPATKPPSAASQPGTATYTDGRGGGGGGDRDVNLDPLEEATATLVTHVEAVTRAAETGTVGGGGDGGSALLGSSKGFQFAPAPTPPPAGAAPELPLLGERPVAGTLLQVNGKKATLAPSLRVHLLHSANVPFDPALATGTYDVEIAQAAAIGDPVARRAALLVIVDRARATSPGSETYRGVADNPFLRPTEAPLSTFGLDVDTASYANVRRFLTSGTLPPPAAVRIEELVNYFPYRYAPPTDGSPLAVHTEVAACPWNAERRLVRVGLKAREVDLAERPAANLVFLVDVSGSMEPANKLPLLVQSMKQLVPSLGERDKVAIVTYADGAQVALPATRGDRKDVILAALDALRAGGSTNGGAGIQEAYRIAQENFVAGGVNRVLLATDGDFNVGVTSDDQLVRLIEEKARSKVFLTILGFGEGNLQDAKMEAIADRGNGQYAYVDSLREGRRVLVEQAAATLVTVAKDVKLQIEFNPVRVAAYRLIGYENRALAAADFRDDAKDAGDLGAGHTVTALYEIVPTGAVTAGVEGLRYQQGAQPPLPTTAAAQSDELLTVKLRWKLPEASESTGREVPVRDATTTCAQASDDFRFAAAVASFGMLLRGSPHGGCASFDQVVDLGAGALGQDPNGWRAEFVDLARKAKALSGR
jgi:Ca-activated chloride channel homolog